MSAPAAPGAGPADRHGRLAPPPEVLAAIEAAVAAVWPRPQRAERRRPVTRPAAWRFSGRWWAAPLVVRRERPR